jgi:hypothetical protein
MMQRGQALWRAALARSALFELGKNTHKPVSE